MKIVVLDGYTLNPGDLSWDGLKALGRCVIHDRTAVKDIVQRAGDAEVVLTNKTPINASAMDRLPRLKYIGVLATGYDVVDVSAARKRGVSVTHIPTYGTESVAQMTFAHILNLTQQVGRHAETVRQGRWSKNADFCYWDTPLIELSGLTLGLIGAGRIGQAVGRIASAFGMQVLAYDASPLSRTLQGVQIRPLTDVIRQSDIISLHCPLTAETRGLISASAISEMKTGVMIINTSRGPLVDEKALARALNAGKVAGAGLDVLAVEPPRADHPLVRAKNCFVTPHISWATASARKRLMEIAVDNLKQYLAGTPVNTVSGSPPSISRAIDFIAPSCLTARNCGGVPAPTARARPGRTAPWPRA